jgi:hypothetical protein
MDWGTLSGEKVLSYLRQRAQIKKIKAEVERRLLQRSSNDDRVQQATRDTYTWVTGHAKTYNEHWHVEGRPSPYENFPSREARPDLEEVFALLDSDERILWFEKSRDMMETWACVAYLTMKAMTIPECGVVFQCQKEDKVKQLVKYAKFLYRSQDQWLQEYFPLDKHIDQQPELSLNFLRGGSIVGIPGGADQIRSLHPWGYLNDESSFQPDAGECFNEALSAVRGKILFNSSAGPGWYADARRDIILNEET